MIRVAKFASAGLAAAVLIAGCSKPDSGAAGGTTTAAPADKKLSIGFFGFAKANSFAQATWAGIQEYAAANNAEATFLDSNFDGPTQVNQLQDAVTSKRYDVIIVQANDGTAMVNPVKQAVAAGIPTVIEFTPVGGKYDTADPQIPGTVTIIDPPTVNGDGLAKLGNEACKTVTDGACKVAYFQGFANYPLDTARTDAAVKALKAGGAAEVISNFVGGYTPDSGRTAMQNLLQAHPDVNVVIGSSQALEGATPLAAGKKITFVGNGGSTQAYDYVNKGTWYGVYSVPEKKSGAKAAELGLAKARGQSVAESTVVCTTLTDFNCLGTKTTLEGQTADYSD
ncbi:sugar ABC transporter substrate-binding protein [Paractinoplanes atraurantiacus]|uniref:Ribose transport system substrate-binding protein n=1 Tax=Paractinoplanes atraurantiacus TaxID=1036182 RepID=A0A285IIU5_9ACTN|nr:sugar ABC transporter substrate-binding protein [Actinoplanes atraurantiacus]SNY47905.1 ribose transport system substrate-binding protein [Actinoplanes atraurantiacus]